LVGGKERKMWQARLSDKYVLQIYKRTDGSWTVSVSGRCPTQDHHQPILSTIEAQREAYSLGRRHFIVKGIAEIPIEFDDLQWVELGGCDGRN
jgi:hypothetical protein